MTGIILSEIPEKWIRSVLLAIICVYLTTAQIQAAENGVARELPFEMSTPVEDTRVHEIIVGCVGDSITYGDGVADDRDNTSYPAFLQSILGDGYDVKNFGLSGSTLIREGDFAYTENATYLRSLDALADLYIIMLGTNDSKQHNWSAVLYREELNHMIDEYQALPSKPDILLMIPPKYFAIVRDDKDGSVIRNEIIRLRIGPILEETAEQRGFYLLDVYELTEDHPEWFDDGLHPNADGNKAIAEAIAELLAIPLEFAGDGEEETSN